MKYLDDNTIPILYNIYFKIDVNNNIYTGFNKIKLNIIKPTKQIQFHGKDLTIKKILFENDNKLNMSFDTNNDIYTIILDSIIDTGIYDFEIFFNGKMSATNGLIKYHHNLTNRIFIYSRFEPIYARKCYPCWDEPKYKVKYQTSIEINDKSYIVLFNTDPESIQQLPTSIIYKFQETIPMSSYVNSFIISKYVYIEAFSKHNIRLRIYIPTDIKDTSCGDFALECGVKMLDFMIDYCNISFPYNKIDFIPINDTAAQGMENYGLIFYNLDYLLFDNKTSTLEQKIDIAHVIAHELAHQWFGNLISINEWNNLWLKESFARFFQYLIVNDIFPLWDTESFNIVKILQTLDYDSLCLKTVKIKHIQKDNIDHIYSKLTYDKGGILLNILMKYIGKEQFKTNIQKYLYKYKYSIVSNESFINSICENLDQTKQNNIKQLILQYLFNNGYPIIQCIDNKINFVSFNSIHLIKNNITNNDIFNQSEIIDWHIPIYTTDNKYLMFNNNSNSLHNYNQIINNKNYSYFRINYDKKQFNYILSNIHNDTSQQHLSIINDLYILGIYLVCPFEYYLIYTNKLINLLLNINDINLFNYYLIVMIYSNINEIKILIKNHIIEQLLINPMNKLINKLNKLFDVFNINQYIKQNNLHLTNNINYNLIVFFLLNIESVESTNLINDFFDRKLFNLYGDLNYIIINRIITNNDIQRLSYFNQIIVEFPHMYIIIQESLPYIKNNKIIDIIFNNLTNKELSIDYSNIINFLSNNEYFLSKFTEYFLSDYELNVSFYSKNSINFNKLIKELIINQTNIGLILKLLLKIKNINKFYIIESKYILFNKLYKNYNLVKIINNLK